MSDPVIKGAKKASSRTAPQSASSKNSARSGKLTAKTAKPKPKRAAAEKAPVRKASPAKSSAKAAKPSAQKPSKQTQKSKAPAKAAGKKQVKAPSKHAAPAKKSGGAKAQPKKGAPASRAHAAKKGAAPAKAAPRPAPAQKRQPTHDEAAALKAFERAHKEFVRGNFSSARESFRALIQQHAGVSEVTARARIYLTIAESRLQSEAALPRDADSLYDRGVIELNRGDFVAAQEMFERALKRDPEAADTHYALAATRARLGAIPSALQSLERAIELRPVLRVRAQNDIDLAPLRSDPEFERIVYATHRP